MEKGDKVVVKITGAEGMIVSVLGDMGYLVRLPNYNEISFREFELILVNEPDNNPSDGTV